METTRKKHELRNYDFCYGCGANWVDMEKGLFYHIQEYREACDKGEHPKGIRVSKWSNLDETIEVVDPVILQERMRDPEPDPRY